MVHKKLEEFYTLNFKNYEISQIKDYIHKRVWNIQFDQTNDHLYAFIAELKIIRPGQMKFDADLNQVKNHPCAHEFENEINAMEIQTNCIVELTLNFEVFNLEDRLLMDKTCYKDINDTK